MVGGPSRRPRNEGSQRAVSTSVAGKATLIFEGPFGTWHNKMAYDFFSLRIPGFGHAAKSRNAKTKKVPGRWLESVSLVIQSSSVNGNKLSDFCE
jgi:hypothetical protein